jgi:hypothetical protein
MGIPLGILCRLIYLDGYYHNHAPRREDTTSGAVVPVHVYHGTTVYLTAEQWLWFDSPTSMAVQSVVFLGAGTIAVVLNRRWKVFRGGDAA